jgi:hypothetical protein
MDSLKVEVVKEHLVTLLMLMELQIKVLAAEVQLELEEEEVPEALELLFLECLHQDTLEDQLVLQPLQLMGLILY